MHIFHTVENLGAYGIDEITAFNIYCEARGNGSYTVEEVDTAIGLALLVLFFVIGVMKTCGSFAEVKKPEHALKLFIRFALAKYDYR